MRSVVTKGGIPTFVSTAEHTFLEGMDGPVYKDTLDEHKAEMARVLTSRGVLQRFSDTDRGIYYIKNQNKGIE